MYRVTIQDEKYRDKPYNFRRQYDAMKFVEAFMEVDGKMKVTVTIEELENEGKDNE